MPFTVSQIHVSWSGLGVLMLGKRLGPVKWSACFLLAFGIMVVQAFDSWGPHGGRWKSWVDSSGPLGSIGIDALHTKIPVLCRSFVHTLVLQDEGTH